MKVSVRKSIFTRLLLAVAVSFLAVILSSFLYLYNGMKDSLRKRTDAEKMQTYHQLNQNVKVFGQEIAYLSDRLIAGASLVRLINFSGESDSETIELKVNFFREADNTLTAYGYVKAICFYNKDQISLVTDGHSHIITEGAKEQGRFYEEVLDGAEGKRPAAVEWYGGYGLEDFPHMGGQQDTAYYITVCRPVFRGTETGWLVINVDLDYFMEIYSTADRQDMLTDITYVVDGQGKIVAHPDRTQVGQAWKKDWVYNVTEGSVSIEEAGMQILCYPMEIGGWIMVNETPLSTILGDISDMQQIFVLAILFILVLSAFFLIFWVRHMSKPLVGTVNALQEMERGRLGIVLPQRKGGEDEISLLITHFNRMSAKIEELLDENARIEEKKRETEIRLLKGQMNPHFLYNTLNTVKWMAAVKGENDIVDCVTALGNLIQPLYRDTGNVWSLADEEEYIVNYSRIMNYRYGEKAILKMESGEAPGEIRVPRFVLQPIVENAFLYGMTGEGRKLEITICGEIVPEDADRGCGSALCLSVTDNGGGLEQEKLMQLRESLEKIPEGKHIGLANVHQRLRLLYGEEAGLQIDSVQGGDFTVKIWIPL